MARGSPETAPWRLVAGRSLSGPCQRWGPGATGRDGHWVVACRCFAGTVAGGHGLGRTLSPAAGCWPEGGFRSDSGFVWL